MSSAILAGQARHIIGNTGWVGSGMPSAILAGWGQACHRQYWLGRLGMSSAILAGQARHAIGNTGWAGSACHRQYWLDGVRRRSMGDGKRKGRERRGTMSSGQKSSIRNLDASGRELSATFSALPSCR